MLHKYAGAVGADGPGLLAAGEALTQHMGIMEQHGCTLPPSAIQDLFDSMKQHLLLMRDFEIFLPKHHLWTHMTARSERNGNPRLVANFLNESLNKLLKGACRNCSQMTFEKKKCPLEDEGCLGPAEQQA